MWRSSNAAVCKTAMGGCNSHHGLNEKCPIFVGHQRGVCSSQYWRASRMTASSSLIFSMRSAIKTVSGIPAGYNLCIASFAFSEGMSHRDIAGGRSHPALPPASSGRLIGASPVSSPKKPRRCLKPIFCTPFPSKEYFDWQFVSRDAIIASAYRSIADSSRRCRARIR